MQTLNSRVLRPLLSRNSRQPVKAVAYTNGQAAQTVVKGRSGLGSKQLHKAALLARLSGLCYYPAEQLEERLSNEGMKLIVSGANSFTRWYVADGVLDRWSESSGPDSQPPETSGRVERVILFRGVVWRSSEVDAIRLWQNLMRFWPSAFAENLTNPPGALLAHAGVAEMAAQLYEPIKEPVAEAQALRRTLNFGGHSLGGSLGFLLAALYRLRLQLPPDGVRCCSFGSPPVLSHAKGGGGLAALQAIGLRPGAVQGFVLENDPVPRALLAADPAFAALKKSAAGDALLRLRQWLLGPGVLLSPTRFLADTVGDLHLVRWSADAGHTVVPLAPEDAENQLAMAAEGGASALQGVLDHAHGSYSLDLDAAARQLEQRGL